MNGVMTQSQAPPGEWLAVGKRIVQARNRAGLEQQDLAALLGMSARNLRFIEKGETNPIPWVTAVAEATHVDGEWIEHGGLILPGELAEAAAALRASLAELRADREVLGRHTEVLAHTVETVGALSKTLEALVELLAARLGPPRERG
jgi:transcriptional regulator with XRE-family HTH domain